MDPIYAGKTLELEATPPEWDQEALLGINEEKLQASSLPGRDFAQPKFDAQNGAKLEQVLLLISTPRSGSTALCEHLYHTGGIIAHEYFQPFQYMPFLANRWSCIDDGWINPERYVKALIKNRISESGVLGINLHGSHINIFEHFRDYLGAGVPINAIYLKRQDKVAQAVSYYIAANTRKWSSHFDAGKASPEYSFSGIKSKLTSILNQEKRAEIFLASNCEASQTVFYETLVNKGVPVPSFLNGVVKSESLGTSSSQTVRQAGLLNTLFSERFLRDLLLRSEVEQECSNKNVKSED